MPEFQSCLRSYIQFTMNIRMNTNSNINLGAKASEELPATYRRISSSIFNATSRRRPDSLPVSKLQASGGLGFRV